MTNNPRFKNSATRGAWDEVQRRWGRAWANLHEKDQQRELESALLYTLASSSDLADAEAFKRHFREAMNELILFIHKVEE